MKAVILTGTGPASLALTERPDPQPGPGEALVALAASSLNFRDLAIVNGNYTAGLSGKTAGLVPLCDGAGVVVAIGPGVTRFAVGDRVVANLFQDWIAGGPTAEILRSDLGGSLSGVACERRAFPEHALCHLPDYLSDLEAASLPCAGLTAWSAVIEEGRVRPGDRVLIQGTGGVSIFALQFALMAGAETIVTSSSDEKLARALALGAHHTINYRRDGEWSRPVRALTAGAGVDLVVEVGGAGTLGQSLKAVRVGGAVAAIGVLSGRASELNLMPILTRGVRLVGVTVGSRRRFERMLRAMALHRLKPVIDRSFALADLPQALEHFAAGAHFGKIGIEIGTRRIAAQ